jgi:hypothetical protein
MILGSFDLCRLCHVGGAGCTSIACDLDTVGPSRNDLT